MADKEISDLTAGAIGDAAAAIFHGVTGGNSRQFTGAQVGGQWVLAGGAYTSAGIWTQASDGTVAEVDFTGLAGMTDFLIIADGVTRSGAGNMACYVSDDNGVTFPNASGNYVHFDNDGTPVNTTRVLMVSSTSTAARGGRIHGMGMNVSGAPKLLIGSSSSAGIGHGYPVIFKESTLPINAVRVKSESAVNFDGGTIYCLVRY